MAPPIWLTAALVWSAFWLVSSEDAARFWTATATCCTATPV
jgi:hypothetical protein